MAVKSSNKATENTIQDFKYWTGVIPYNVVAVNPNLEELKEIGIEYFTKEPEYIQTANFQGKESVSTIVEFWLQAVKTPETPEGLELLTNVRFRINHDVFVGSNSGKTQYINAYGRTAWAIEKADLAANKYYRDVDSRPAHKGEEDLHKFLFAWLNMTYDGKAESFDECLLDVNKLISGDFTELEAVVAGSKEYVVKCLTGVTPVEKDGKMKYYQAVYNQMFLKHSQHSTIRLDSYINDNEYNSFGTDERPVVYTYNIQAFDKSAKPDEDVKKEEVTNNNIF